MDPLHIDLETRSAANLTKVGAHRYAEDHSTRIILGSYRFGAGPVRRWVGEELPLEVRCHLEDNLPMAGHNQQFERVVLNARCDLGITPDQQDCTLSRALAMGLPASLGQVDEVLNLTIKKDDAGHALMMRMCKDGHVDTADQLERLAAYCDTDVEAECGVDAKLPALSERERRVWILDQTINDRGFAIDLPRVQIAHGAVLEAKKRADAAIWRVTNGAVSTVNQVAKLVDWLNSRGIPASSVADSELDDIICGAELLDDASAIEAVGIRRAAAGAFKFEAMSRAVCHDGRVRGCLQYHGTHGGRWAGRVVQPHNFKRQDSEDDQRRAALAVDLMGQYADPVAFLDALSLFDDKPLEALTLCARPMIVAPRGKRLLNADFSNIEGRLNAWFAGEAWKVQAFRDYDAGLGPDLYKVTASRVLDKAIEDIAKEERQNQGKLPELACGYQGGHRAFLKMAAKYGAAIPQAKAQQIVRDWREANPAIVESWNDLGRAAIDAVDNPGVIVACLGGKVQYLKPAGQDFLFCCLPSGRVISYAMPTLGWSKKYFDPDGKMVLPDELAELTREERGQLDESNTFGITFLAAKNGRVRRTDLYGGMQCAHVVSGTARDALVEAMFAVEREGFPLVLTVHDELLSEADHGSAAEYRQIIEAAPPSWLKGLPLVTKADEGERYTK